MKCSLGRARQENILPNGMLEPERRRKPGYTIHLYKSRSPSKPCKTHLSAALAEQPRRIALLTLPEACAGGCFLHPARVPRALANTARRGGLSRSDWFRRKGTRSHLPGGTESGCYYQSSRQNMEGCVLVPIPYKTTGGADMGTHRERFLPPNPTAAALLRRVARRDGHDRHISSRAVGADVRSGTDPTWQH
jgi:hypothetical protein